MMKVGQLAVMALGTRSEFMIYYLLNYVIILSLTCCLAMFIFRCCLSLASRKLVNLSLDSRNLINSQSQLLLIDSYVDRLS